MRHAVPRGDFFTVDQAGYPASDDAVYVRATVLELLGVDVKQQGGQGEAALAGRATFCSMEPVTREASIPVSMSLPGELHEVR